MITKLEMLDLLKEADLLNLGTFKTAATDSFTEVINTAMPEVTREQARRALLKMSAERTTENRGQFLTPGDWLKAIRELNSGDLEIARARLKAEIAHNGQFAPEGLYDPSDAHLGVKWQQAATKAFLNGATREQAEQHAWISIGRTQPAIEPTEQHTIDTSQIGR